MDEKKTDPSGYEPNFVMKDAAEPEATENQHNMAENQPDMPEDPAKAAAPPGDQEDFAQTAASGASNDFEKKGAFRDPREAFRNTEPGTSSYQYNEHNRPGSVKDNFGGSPYTGYVDENGNMQQQMQDMQKPAENLQQLRSSAPKSRTERSRRAVRSALLRTAARRKLRRAAARRKLCRAAARRRSLHQFLEQQRRRDQDSPCQRREKT